MNDYALMVASSASQGYGSGVSYEEWATRTEQALRRRSELACCYCGSAVDDMTKNCPHCRGNPTREGVL